MQFSLEPRNSPVLRSLPPSDDASSHLPHMRTIHHPAMSKAYLRAIRFYVDAAKFTETFADRGREAT